MFCSWSNITALNKYTFRTINCTTSSLITLHLYKNNITEVRNVHFNTLIHLKHIFLNHNNIKTVNRLLFFNNTKLEYINLSHNRITSNFFLYIDGLPSLKYLDVSYNSLSLLNQTVFENYIIQVTNDNTKELNISGSEFRCGCDMKWISDLRYVIFIKVHYLAKDVCIPCLLFKQKVNQLKENCQVINNLMCDIKGWII